MNDNNFMTTHIFMKTRVLSYTCEYVIKTIVDNIVLKKQYFKIDIHYYTNSNNFFILIYINFKLIILTRHM